MPKRLYTSAAPAALDETDRELLSALAEDSRIAVSELARQIGLSAPSTAERLRRLETLGIIERFTVQIDPRALGYTLQAIVRVKPLPGQLHLVEEVIRRIPEFVECDKVTGDDCFVCRLVLRSIEQLDEILSKVTERAETSTAIIKSTPVPRRLPPLTPPQPPQAVPAELAETGAPAPSLASSATPSPAPSVRGRSKR